MNSNLDTVLKKRWLILIISCFMNLCIGVTLTWSIFAAPLAERLNQVNGLTGEGAFTAGSLVLVFSLTNFMSPFGMVLGGRFNDRIGPKKVLLCAGFFYAVGLWICGSATQAMHIYLGYGLLAGLSVNAIYGTNINNCVKWFPDKAGLAGGLTTASYGLSSVIFSFLGNYFTLRVGIQMTLYLWAILAIVVICSGSFFVSGCPETFYQQLMGTRSEGQDMVTVNYTWQQMLKTGWFYGIFLMCICSSFFALMVFSQASSLAQNMIGMSATAAALTVSLLSLCNGFARMVIGAISDRWGRLNVYLGAYTAAILGIFLVYCSDGSKTALFLLGMGVIGLCYGAMVGVLPGFVTDQFGSKHNSVNFGIINLAFALGGYLGPMVLAIAYARYGTYQQVFLLAMLFCAVGILLSLLMKIKLTVKWS